MSTVKETKYGCFEAAEEYSLEDAYHQPAPSGIGFKTKATSPFYSAGVFLAALSLGTGTMNPEHVMRFTESMSTTYSFVPRRLQVRSVREMVEAMLDAFSLPVKQLARVLQVERPTVYAWRSESEPRLRPENRDRLEAVYGFVEEWNKLNVGPAGSKVLIPLANGKSLADLLSETQLDQQAIREAMSAVAEHIRGKKSPFQTGSVTEWREKLRRRGFTEPSEEAQRLNLEEQDRRDRYDG